jgi:hypothetical protein
MCSDVFQTNKSGVCEDWVVFVNAIDTVNQETRNHGGCYRLQNTAAAVDRSESDMKSDTVTVTVS